MSSTQLSDIYTGGYKDLRREARDRSPEAVRQVAQQFEAYFLQQVLRESQKTLFPDPYFDPKSYEVYRDMLNQQLALGMSRTGRFGFAEMIERQLSNVTPANREITEWSSRSGGDSDRAGTTSSTGEREAQVASAGPSVSTLSPTPRADSSEPLAKPRFGSEMSGTTTPSVDYQPSVGPEHVAVAPPGGFITPDAFVGAVLPIARKVASRLGVRPDVLVAQAALETGWGRHLAQTSDGVSSNNLFGIKAHGGWKGPTVVKPTLEYIDGVVKKMRAAFRAYSNIEASMNDYVQFVSNNSRYSHAVKNAGDPSAYLNALQSAGYATDPKYAQKIMALMERPEISSLLAPARA